MEVGLRPNRVAVLSRSFSNHPVLRAELQAHYPDAKFNESGRTLSGEELIAFVAGYDGVVVALEKIGRDVLSRMSYLRVLSKYGVGLDNIDLAAASERGIQLGWTAGVNRRSVAELAIGMMISLLHLIPQLNLEVRQGVWRQVLGRELGACTIGVVGCGHVGQEVVRLLRAFGCRVLVHDIRTLEEYCTAHGATQVPIETLLRESDGISVHLPATPATRLMFDATAMDRMRKGSLLVNTARGGLVDEVALKERLLSGHLGGAAFDVFASEPPSDTELLNLPNMLVTPHIGGSAAEAVLAMGRAAIAGLFAARDPLEYVPSWAA